MRKRPASEPAPLRILVSDDSRDAIEQVRTWILERWPGAEVLSAITPEEAVAAALASRVENLLLDLDFGSRHNSGIVIARRVVDERAGEDVPTRVLFRTVHASDPGYLHQIERLIRDERQRPAVWGFLDKGSVPKRLALNVIEQVFLYEISFTEVFNQQLKDSPSRDLTDLEFTVLIQICLGVTNDGIAWLLGASRQSVERILTGLYRKVGVPSRRAAPPGVPTLLESRTRLCYAAMTRGWVNPHLLREEDALLRGQMAGPDAPRSERLYMDKEWLAGADAKPPTPGGDRAAS